MKPCLVRTGVDALRPGGLACETLRPEMALQFPTRAERPGKQPHAASLRERGIWPEFMYHDPVLERLFDRVISEYAEFQFYAWNDEREEVVGVGNALPATWDGRPESLPDGGLDAIVEARFADEAVRPNVLCALQILIAPECRGQELSSRMIQRMADIGQAHGLDTLIAPVRPNLKHRYPLTPIESYIAWRRPDGALLDPWLRTHERLGAEIARVAPESVRIPGAVAQWEEWTGLAFPETGSYIVSGALVPIEIDCERDEGLYLEPNVWMVHPHRAGASRAAATLIAGSADHRAHSEGPRTIHRSAAGGVCAGAHGAARFLACSYSSRSSSCCCSLRRGTRSGSWSASCCFSARCTSGIEECEETGRWSAHTP